MKITWAPVAVERVEEISRLIATENPSGAAAWVEDLFQAVERLSSFPESGRTIREIPSGPYRQILHGEYRIIYRLQGKRLFVLTVRHGRRQLDRGEL